MTAVLLALDVARVTGVAWGALDAETPQTARWTLPHKDRLDAVGARVAALENTLGPFLDQHGPAWLVMAERFQSRNMGEAAASFGLDGIVRAECWRRRIPILVQPEPTVRKEILGRGRAPTQDMKDLVTGWCIGMGITAADHNAADAAVMWWWTRAELVRQRRIAA